MVKEQSLATLCYIFVFFILFLVIFAGYLLYLLVKRYRSDARLLLRLCCHDNDRVAGSAQLFECPECGIINWALYKNISGAVQLMIDECAIKNRSPNRSLISLGVNSSPAAGTFPNDSVSHIAVRRRSINLTMDLDRFVDADLADSDATFLVSARLASDSNLTLPLAIIAPMNQIFDNATTSKRRPAATLSVTSFLDVSTSTKVSERKNVKAMDYLMSHSQCAKMSPVQNSSSIAGPVVDVIDLQGSFSSGGRYRKRVEIETPAILVCPSTSSVKRRRFSLAPRILSMRSSSGSSPTHAYLNVLKRQKSASCDDNINVSFSSAKIRNLSIDVVGSDRLNV